MPKRKAALTTPAANTDAKAVAPSSGGHSRLGGSSADRYIHCSGSVYLREKFGVEEVESEFATEGTVAHAAAAICLLSGEDAWTSIPDVEQARAVQMYLDYARGLDGDTMVELDVRAPAFHPDAFGRLDLAVFNPDGFEDVALEIVDYKHGIGVQVSAIGNAQTRSYAQWFIDGETWPAHVPRLESAQRVKLTIAQPRGYHPEGPIRSEILTVGELSSWVYGTLRPAMQNAGKPQYAMGDWCHFCPAKLMCPEQRALAGDAMVAVAEIEAMVQRAEPAEAAFGKAAQLAKLDNEWLDAWYGRLELLDWFKKAVRDTVGQRAKLRPEAFKNAKLVYAIADRQWKSEAKPQDTFGDAAYTERKILSPAQIEKLPGGVDFCAEWAFKPPTELVVAPINDKRKAQTQKTDAEVFVNAEIPLTAEQW